MCMGTMLQVLTLPGRVSRHACECYLLCNCTNVLYWIIDRLPPIDASQALEQLEDEKSQPISTSISKLDKILLDTAPFNPASVGGIQRGQVTEVWGPPGSGRTALG